MVIIIIRTICLTLFIFGLLGWIYIAGNAWFHPQTLSMGLTHFAKWPREDTFGEVSFLTSFIAFFIWYLLKNNKRV